MVQCSRIIFKLCVELTGGLLFPTYLTNISNVFLFLVPFVLVQRLCSVGIIMNISQWYGVTKPVVRSLGGTLTFYIPI